MNEALHRAGHPEMVRKHDVRYGQLQATASSKPPGGTTTPSGNWSQNYYADGVVGGNIPYEIDETGLGIWTLWDHYTETRDRNYLISSDVYESIQRAAHYLTDDTPIGCRDPGDGVAVQRERGRRPQPPAHAHRCAGCVARCLGRREGRRGSKGVSLPKPTPTGGKRVRTSCAVAIRQNFFDRTCTCYTRDYQTGGTLPVARPLRPEQLEGRRRSSRGELAPHLPRAARQGGPGRARDQSASRQLLRVGRGQDLRRLKKGLRWVATKPTTNETGLLAKAWMVFPPNKKGTLTTMVSQPHVWSHAMFYLAALRAYGTEAGR